MATPNNFSARKMPLHDGEVPVAEIPEECLRFIKPVVNREIVFCSSLELPCAALRVFEWVSHGYTSYVVVV